MYLLDTNIVSELRLRRERIDPALATLIDGTAPVDLYISAVTIFEIELGVRLSEHGKDKQKAMRLRHWLEHQVIPGFADRVLFVDLAIARRASALHVPNPRPLRDSLIAATAIVHRLKVVTRNIKDFEPMGVEIAMLPNS
jgi:predicted nucleic acid-binding protein